MAKLLKIYRADPSDGFAFEAAAAAGEWAVSGAFVFAQTDLATLTGKAKRAFEIGFLGIQSFGRATFAQVVEAGLEQRASAAELLAGQLLSRFGAPDLAHAREAAAEEIAFAESLADHPLGTLIAVSRRYANGAVHESFRTLSPRLASGPIRVFALHRDAP